MRVMDEPLASILAATGIVGLISLFRFLDLADGALLGATAASGLALGAAVLLRFRGALAAGLAFACAGLAWGLPPAAAALDGAAHGFAAALAAMLMRTLARRRAARSRTSDWLIFFAGVVVFTLVVAGSRLAGVARGWTPGAPGAWDAVVLTAVFEPLGIFTICAALFSWREYRSVLEAPRPAFVIAGLAAGLLGVLALLLASQIATVSSSGWTLMLAVPFCLWVAMQRRSLDGAALSLIAVNIVLTMLVRDTGSIRTPEFFTAVLYLNLLVATAQLVHAVNLDRLGALAEVEAQKRDLEARVTERTARLTAMTEKALAADAAKTRFLATVSHEVRTPLTGVLGMASVVLDGDLDPPTRAQIEIIRTSGHHMLDVINRILDYSHFELGRAEGEKSEAFDLASMIDEVLAEARFLPYAAGLTLRAALPADLATRRRGYRMGLRQILTNFVGNAAKFTEAGTVTVGAVETAGLLRIEVRDSGIGVSPEEVERIFLPFERSDDPFARTKVGTGLGLAICADVARRMGGRIGVTSVPGAGSTFWVELDLPAVAETADAAMGR